MKSFKLKHHWIEFATWVALLLLVFNTAMHYDLLPERIPTHFNKYGFADGFGDKSTLWVLVGLAIFICTIMFALKPLVRSTSISPIQAGRALFILSSFSFLITYFILYLNYMSIRIAKGQAESLHSYSVGVFLVIVIILSSYAIFYQKGK